MSQITERPPARPGSPAPQYLSAEHVVAGAFVVGYAIHLGLHYPPDVGRRRCVRVHMMPMTRFSLAAPTTSLVTVLHGVPRRNFVEEA